MKKIYFILLLLVWSAGIQLEAQNNVTESVLKDHTWYKLAVMDEGAYCIGYDDLQSLGIDMSSIVPSQIRLFGNEAGMLPERNRDARPDDLSELSILVTGSDDGSFDRDDKIVFYGQGPVKWSLEENGTYVAQRNAYSDSVFYYLCLDSGEEGLRVLPKASVTPQEDSHAITRFPDFIYHESEEISPYSQGRVWYGDMINMENPSKVFEFPIDNLVKSEVLSVDSKVLGRSNKVAMQYSLWANENLVVDAAVISGFSNQVYGYEHRATRQFFADEEKVTLRYELRDNGANPMLFIDYFTLNFWKELVFVEDELPFRITPEQQKEQTVSKVLVRCVTSDLLCWDVTQPLHPGLQQGDFSAGSFSFGLDDHQEHRYFLFDIESAKPISAIYPIHNQNIHGIMTAHMLIFTPRAFWEQAQELAAYHLQEDQLNCVVVDVEEVYNEFGTGIPDPSSMRDFIRMIYQRSNQQLQYVLLMGKGSFDYRNILGRGNNFVLTYETENLPYSEIYSYCSDDYFGLMGPDEGVDCEGYVDLGVGRFPVTTAEQAEKMINKVKHYKESHGLWKNYHYFAVDNDSRDYLRYQEQSEKILDTACHAMTVQKIFWDSYPLVQTPSGEAVPEASKALNKAFDEGMLVMSYIGHGGVKGWSKELVLSISDIQAMKNFHCMPFVHTATCEFSKFDNPSVVSAGELMAMQPNGGAIAMLTTTRPTFGPHNDLLAKSLHNELYRMEDGKSKRFGDIVKASKSNQTYYHAYNKNYVLYGDPALRFDYPDEVVSTSYINNHNGSHEIVVHANELVNVMGTIQTQNGTVDEDFNGVLEIRLFDKKSTFTTIGALTDQRDYSYFVDVLYEGKVSVREGRFSAEFMIPNDINYSYGPARLTYYAYDSIRQVDAMGIFENMTLGGKSEPAVDSQGPDIQIYINNPSFESGDTIAHFGTLVANLFDEQGIYHYNVSIGRDIVLYSNMSDYNNIVMNSHFEPALNDYQRGSVIFPLEELKNGNYTFTIKAWDTQNNSSESTIWFTVADGNLLTAVYSFPNPSRGDTYFTFCHGDKSEDLDVRVDIYDVMGRHVVSLNEHTSSPGGVVAPIHWDGRGQDGALLKAGIYVYRLSIVEESGIVRSTTQRLLIN